MRKLIVTVLALLALPAFLIIYNPSLQLGGFGLMLGMIGFTISPLILLAALVYMVRAEWKKNSGERM